MGSLSSRSSDVVCNLLSILHNLESYLFKVALGISRTNADSQWNPVYKAFHRIQSSSSLWKQTDSSVVM